MLKLAEKGCPKIATTPPVLSIRAGKIQKKKKPQGAKGKGKGKGKQAYAPKQKISLPPARAAKIWIDMKPLGTINTWDLLEKAFILRLCGGPRLDRECPLNEEEKVIKEVKYGKFGRSFPKNGGSGARYRNQNVAFKNMEIHVEQLTKDFKAKAAKEAPSSSTPFGYCKVIFADDDA
ncbi:hypothetical protein Tco_0047880 [Tanacetum coccineum]